MKKVIFLFLLYLTYSTMFSQGFGGRYFEEIKGTTWQSDTPISFETLLKAEEIGLTLMEMDIDSLKGNSVLWTFNDSLKIETYNATTKARTTILDCPYKKDSQTLSLFLDEQIMEFEYSTVSSEAFVLLTKNPSAGK